MKRFLVSIVMLAFVFSVAPVGTSYAATVQPYNETAIDHAGDWFATLGKQGVEKQMILSERKADRVRHHAERQAEKARREAEKQAMRAKKEAGKTAKDAKKKLGF